MNSRLTDFMAEPVYFMNALAKSDEMKRIRLGPKPFVFVFNPEAAQEILVRRSGTYLQNRTVFDRIQPVTGKKGVVQLSGAESQVARNKSRAMFTSASLESARSIIEAYTQEMLEKVESIGKFDASDELTFLILRTTLKIFLGVDSTELVAQIGHKFLRLNYLCGLRMRSLVPAPLFIPTFKNREIKSLTKEIRHLIANHIASRTDTGVPRVFHQDPALIDHCMTFLFAGHETTASSLAFTLLLLAKNQKYQNSIADGGEEAALVVYKESLRLFPPAYMLARQAASDDELCGLKVRKGDQVIIGICEMQRNSKYFDRPDDFFPERFQEKLKHPFSFIPFGAGSKSCLGERLAYLEASVVLNMICKRFSLSCSDEPIKSEPLITLHPLGNQFIQIQRRT